MKKEYVQKIERIQFVAICYRHWLLRIVVSTCTLLIIWKDPSKATGSHLVYLVCTTPNPVWLLFGDHMSPLIHLLGFVFVITFCFGRKVDNSKERLGQKFIAWNTKFLIEESAKHFQATLQALDQVFSLICSCSCISVSVKQNLFARLIYTQAFAQISYWYIKELYTTNFRTDIHYVLVYVTRQLTQCQVLIVSYYSAPLAYRFQNYLWSRTSSSVCFTVHDTHIILSWLQ